MPSITDFADGSRVILFTTPCGYEITLIRNSGGKFRWTAHRDGHLVHMFLDPSHTLSADGAKLLSERLTDLYGDYGSKTNGK